MPALNYKPGRFAEGVRAGEITMAIRRRDQRLFKPGCTLFHYQDQKKKGGGELLCTTKMVAADLILITANQRLFIGGWHDENIIDPELREAIAQANGYSSWTLMFRYFHRYYFKKPHPSHYAGVLIQW